MTDLLTDSCNVEAAAGQIVKVLLERDGIECASESGAAYLAPQLMHALDAAQTVEAVIDWLFDQDEIVEIHLDDAELTELIEHACLAHRLGRVARHAQLEAIIIEQPDDIDAHAVYADWLSSRGDPLGRWLTLCLSGADPAQLDAVLDGPESPFGDLRDTRETALMAHWRHGFIRRARVRGAGHNAVHLDRLLDRRVMRLCEHLELCDAENQYNALDAARLPLLETLVLGSSPYTFRSQSLDLSTLVARLPGVRALGLDARYTRWSTTISDHLDAFGIVWSPTRVDWSTAFWPRLTRLDIAIHSIQHVETLSACLAAVDELKAPRLRTIRLFLENVTVDALRRVGEMRRYAYVTTVRWNQNNRRARDLAGLVDAGRALEHVGLYLPGAPAWISERLPGAQCVEPPSGLVEAPMWQTFGPPISR